MSPQAEKRELGAGRMALARQLIRHLGFEAAAETCRQNGWQDILEEIERRRAAVSPGTAG
ncbi:MAG: hypothetical protein KatS3mg119_0778 [Rhodothalassiaceae bacterium]|nr:MAG: hypothetical protein KatS3mg119_0778 [Rhodothalassiaceae bacterium]